MFNSSIPDELFRPQLRVMRIIHAAIIMGLVGFLCIAIFIATQNGQARNEHVAVPIQTIMSIGLAALMVVMWAVLPGFIARTQVQQIAEGKTLPLQRPVAPGLEVPMRLLQVYQTTLIIALALLEGAGFFGCIAYIVERNQISLAVVGALILLMMASFPTRDRILNWVETQSRRVAELREHGVVRFSE